VLSLFAFHALYAQSGLGVGIVLVGLTASLAWTHRAAYAPLFAAAALVPGSAPSRRAVTE